MPVHRKVLHVDDDPQFTRLVAAHLRPLGFELHSVNDPKLCLQQLRREDYPVVLLDIDMPGVDGMQLLRDIKSQDGGAQVIMLTGLVSMTTVLQSLRWGAEACIFKPFTDPAMLIAAIERAFAKLDAWWDTLEDLSARRRNTKAAMEAAHVSPSLQPICQ